MPLLLTILAPAGRDTNGHKLVRVKCACGSSPFVVREGSIKSGNTKSCGCLQGKKRKKVAEKLAPIPIAQSEAPYERGTPAWYTDQIASKEAAALVSEKHVRDLQAQMAASESTDLDLLKRWTAESTAFEKLNQQISRLQLAKAKAETGTLKNAKTQADLVKDKIKALKGSEN